MIAAATPLRVYVVEDSPIVQKFLRSGIESVGGELVGSSDNAQSAIRELPRLKPDLVVVDLALVWGSGFEVLEAIQTGAAGRNTAAVVLTNHVAPEDRERSLHLGASHFFDKATEGWRVLELINKMAARRRKTDRPGDDDE